MKRWPWVVVGLYGLALILLTVPVVVGSFWSEFFGQYGKGMTSVGGLALGALKAWGYWLGLAVLILAQAVLLIIPVRIAEKRPITKRTVIQPIIVSAFLMGLLSVGIVFATGEAIKGEPSLSDPAFSIITWIASILFVCSWVFWAVVFFRFSRKLESKLLIDKICTYFFRGSIVELLVAVPTHVLARYRNYCCAGFLTFGGLAFGIALMVFAFGPGIFFLFVERWRRLHPAKK